MRRITAIAVTILVVCSVLLAACDRANGGTGCKEPAKGEALVYVAGPLSGFQANAGQTVLGGAHLAAEQINCAGGLLGYKVTIVGVDDQSDSDVAAGIAEQIAAAVDEGQNVLGVIGHLNSGQTLAAM